MLSRSDLSTICNAASISAKMTPASSPTSSLCARADGRHGTPSHRWRWRLGILVDDLCRPQNSSVAAALTNTSVDGEQTQRALWRRTNRERAGEPPQKDSADASPRLKCLCRNLRAFRLFSLLASEAAPLFNLLSCFLLAAEAEASQECAALSHGEAVDTGHCTRLGGRCARGGRRQVSAAGKRRSRGGRLRSRRRHVVRAAIRNHCGAYSSHAPSTAFGR